MGRSPGSLAISSQEVSAMNEARSSPIPKLLAGVGEVPHDMSTYDPISSCASSSALPAPVLQKLDLFSGEQAQLAAAKLVPALLEEYRLEVSKKNSLIDLPWEWYAERYCQHFLIHFSYILEKEIGFNGTEIHKRKSPQMKAGGSVSSQETSVSSRENYSPEPSFDCDPASGINRQPVKNALGQWEWSSSSKKSSQGAPWNDAPSGPDWLQRVELLSSNGSVASQEQDEVEAGVCSDDGSSLEDSGEMPRGRRPSLPPVHMENDEDSEQNESGQTLVLPYIPLADKSVNRGHDHLEPAVRGDVLSPLSRQHANSDLTPRCKASFLRRMSLKNLGHALINPFHRRPSQLDGMHGHGDKEKENSKVGKTKSDATDSKESLEDPITICDSSRPRLASAPACDLNARNRLHYARAATAPFSQQTAGLTGSGLALTDETSSVGSCSSLVSLPAISRLRKSSLTSGLATSPSSLVGRQSPAVANASLQEDAHAEENVMERLMREDWYHSEITRNQAASAVLSVAKGKVKEDAFGKFLVRASETRPGEFVLTFNAHGRPKHLRFCIFPGGQCRIQSMSFESVPEMLDYYQHNPLPMESGQSSDVMLGNYASSAAAASESPRKAPQPADSVSLSGRTVTVVTKPADEQRRPSSAVPLSSTRRS